VTIGLREASVKYSAGIGLVCLSLFAASPAAAENSAVPIRLVVPFAPGGSSDTVARLIAGPLGEALNRTVLVENRSGAGGAIGTDAVAKAAPDGNTLLVAFDSHTLLPVINKSLPYEIERDFVPVSRLTAAPLVITTSLKLEARSVGDLVAIAKNTRGGLNYGSVPGSSSHLAGILFSSVTGAPMVHVSYRGGAPAVTDLLGGQLDVIFAGPQVVAQHIDEGRLRAVAVTSSGRYSRMPNLPTVLESGFANFEVSTYVGLLAPAKTPPDIVARYEGEVVKVMRNQAVRNKLAAVGLDVVASSGQEFAAFIHADLARWREVSAKVNLRIDE
jgi:tripartite-type tricarboxylate transporter receptor subunit TctC